MATTRDGAYIRTNMVFRHWISGLIENLKLVFVCTIEEGFIPTLSTSHFCLLSFEPRCEKTGLRGFRPGPTQTRLYSYTRWLEA